MSRAIVVLALVTSSTASADVVPAVGLGGHGPVGPQLTAQLQVIALGTDAPRDEQTRAAAAARRSAQSLLPRLERCVADRGAAAPGPVSARLELDRAVRPSRARIIEGRGALRACVAEVLPEIALDAAPHGRIVLEVTFAPRGWVPR